MSKELENKEIVEEVECEIVEEIPKESNKKTFASTAWDFTKRHGKKIVAGTVLAGVALVGYALCKGSGEYLEIDDSDSESASYLEDLDSAETEAK